MTLIPNAQIISVAACTLLVGTTFAHAADVSPELIAKAKQEGQLTYYTDLIVDQIVRPLAAAFEAKYAINVPVNCDRGRIGQLVSNIVGNALTHGAANEPVRVRAATEKGLFRLSVANRGEPIPEAAIEKLFEPFFRGEVRESGQGLGLGLHISSQIAKAHDGALTVTSTPEETRFTFVMPLR